MAQNPDDIHRADHIVMMAAVRGERQQQIEKWGHQNHPAGTGSEVAAKLMEQWKEICDANNAAGKDDWATIAAEEFLEVLAETDPRKLFNEVVQLAAVMVAWGESMIEDIRKGEQQ